jgi:lambda repressor-like predicted transcriptional regulator
MHPAQIKAALAVAGYKQVDLAREFSLEAGTISAIINGRSRSKQIEEKIAEITRLDPATLWPQWYGEAPLILSSEERDFMLDYRACSPTMQARLREQARQGEQHIPASHAVHADRGSYAAGGDMNIGAGRKGKKR